MAGAGQSSSEGEGSDDTPSGCVSLDSSCTMDGTAARTPDSSASRRFDRGRRPRWLAGRAGPLDSSTGPPGGHGGPNSSFRSVGRPSTACGGRRPSSRPRSPGRVGHEVRGDPGISFRLRSPAGPRECPGPRLRGDSALGARSSAGGLAPSRNLTGLAFRGIAFRGIVFRGLVFRGLVLRGLVLRGLVLRDPPGKPDRTGTGSRRAARVPPSRADPFGPRSHRCPSAGRPQHRPEECPPP